MPHIPPGRLKRDEKADVLLMIGTAGHVDHGKTRLVRLLTGCETDRLKVEKERGLSIELGFAPCTLGQGIAAGIVDVPGHEQFIKNMVAGAAGMDLTILVVAADDGVMPQTIEHLQIMQFLGVQYGMVALTKIDLVEPNRIDDVRSQIEALTEGTFLKGAPICPVSSETLEGFDGFYQSLVTTALAARIERREGVFRMPVERVFSPPGFGTVATGIPFAGSVKIGDEVEVQPGNHRVRVRGIQRFLQDSQQGRSGQCLALNLAGLPKETIERGGVVALPGTIQSRSFLAVVLNACHDLPVALRSGIEVRLHTGTLEVQARLNLFDCSVLERGQTAYGSLKLTAPAPVASGDRFVIRLNSPTITAAGGVILRALERRPRGKRAELAEELKNRWAAFGTLESRLEYHFLAAGTGGSTIREATAEILLEEAQTREIVSALQQKQVLIACPEKKWIHKQGWEAAKTRLLQYLDRYHQEHSPEYGPTMDEAATALRIYGEIISAVAESLLSESKIERRENRIALKGRREMTDEETGLPLRRMEELFAAGGFATPRPDELAGLLKVKPTDAESALNSLCKQGTLVRLGKNVVFHRKWMREAEKRVVEEIQSKGQLDSGDFKTIIGSSRKYALAILDHFDTIHITRRVDNLRWLHPSYQRKLPDSVY